MAVLHIKAGRELEEWNGGKMEYWNIGMLE
jgi:hypothetical protein